MMNWSSVSYACESLDPACFSSFLSFFPLTLTLIHIQFNLFNLNIALFLKGGRTELWWFHEGTTLCPWDLSGNRYCPQ